ncbi:hypothetical protein PPROV_000152700 [Pycnococcus provasolii]|uniref:Uncharacterized protein n=1 Tax=Pycnococcus provasolii TaxID=41880 RepID=A0A830H867_9CHLO|nr:hypothetical protein PPROV_000152700 [Pycnococcus provasolii]
MHARTTHACERALAGTGKTRAVRFGERQAAFGEQDLTHSCCFHISKTGSAAVVRIHVPGSATTTDHRRHLTTQQKIPNKNQTSDSSLNTHTTKTTTTHRQPRRASP